MRGVLATNIVALALTSAALAQQRLEDDLGTQAGLRRLGVVGHRQDDPARAGLESGEEHTFSAEAVSETRVLVVKRSALFALAERDSEIARQLWALTSNELRRLQDHVLALIKTAKERVVGFLLEMARRTPSGNRIDLPMSRQDIADYLGLTIETVSRTLTQLESSSAIALPNARCFELRDRAALGLSAGYEAAAPGPRRTCRERDQLRDRGLNPPHARRRACAAGGEGG